MVFLIVFKRLSMDVGIFSVESISSRLRKRLAELRSENDELKDFQLTSERDANRKDRLLQELLGTAVPGPGVDEAMLEHVKLELSLLLKYGSKKKRSSGR